MINEPARPLNGGMDLHILLGALLIGAGVGFLSGAFGKGGSAVSTPLLHALGFIAVVFGAANVFGGFVVTDRMLEMFRKREPGADGDKKNA